MAELIAPEAQQKEPNQTKSPAELGQESVCKRVKKLLNQSQKATNDYRERWQENYDFVVRGKQWSLQRPRYRFQEVVNITWADIMTEVGIQTDGRPKVDYQATEASDFQFAEVLKDINDINWEKSHVEEFGWQMKTQTMIFQSKLYDVVHAEVKWDPKMSGGIGDVGYIPLNPFGSYWDPYAKNIGEARYFIQADPTPVTKLKRKYPNKADQIKPDVSMAHGASKDTPITEYNRDLSFTTTGPVGQLHNYGNDREGSDPYGGEEMALLIRCWIRDDETLEELAKTENGEEQFVTRLKYPKGRYIEVVNDLVLKEEGEFNPETGEIQVDQKDPNIYEDGKFPIATLLNYDYGEYAGENEVTHRKGIQKMLNYTFSHIADQFKMGSNPQKIVSHAAQKVAKKLNNKPGAVVVVPNTSDIRYETGPGIASGSFNLLDSIVSLSDKVGGLQDAVRGAPQPNVTSGLMLEGFVEAAQTRPRMKNRSVDEFLTQVGYLCASRYLQFYTAPRTFRITNKEGFPEFVEFFVQGEGDDRQAMVKRVTPEGEVIEQGALSAKGMPDVKPVSGSNLPFAKAQKTATALDLHSRGAITLESMLDAINWPNSKEEVEKVKAEQQALAQQQAQGEV